MTLSTKHLQIALHIRAGVNAFRELNKAIGNAPTTGWTQQYLKELRAEGIVIWAPHQKRTLQLTERGWRALVNYCLLPGGGVGVIECKEQEKPQVGAEVNG